MIDEKSHSLVFTPEEMQEINDIRMKYEDLTNREKFLVKEALKAYFYSKKS